jgi:hypothetical protein
VVEAFLPQFVTWMADARRHADESGKTLLAAGIALADNVVHDSPCASLEDLMKTARSSALWQCVGRPVAVAAVGACIAGTAHADSRAAQKLGQMNIINQNLQPKPLRAPPANSTAPNPNTSSTYDANGAANANARNAATPPAGAYPLKPNTK